MSPISRSHRRPAHAALSACWGESSWRAGSADLQPWLPGGESTASSGSPQSMAKRKRASDQSHHPGGTFPQPSAGRNAPPSGVEFVPSRSAHPKQRQPVLPPAGLPAGEASPSSKRKGRLAANQPPRCEFCPARPLLPGPQGPCEVWPARPLPREQSSLHHAPTSQPQGRCQEECPRAPARRRWAGSWRITAAR